MSDLHAEPAPEADPVPETEPAPEADHPPGTDPARLQTASADGSSRAVAVLLAVAAIVAAIITARASLVSSDATSAWNDSVAVEQRRGAQLLEEMRYAYSVEGDVAFMLTITEERAASLRAAADAAEAAGQPSEVTRTLRQEADALQQVRDLAGPASDVVSNARYALPGGGYDIQRRLADTRAEDPDGMRADPLLEVATGDAAASESNRLMLSTIGVAMAFLCGALAQAFGRHRRMLLLLGWLALGVGAAAALAIVGDVPGVAA